MQEMVQSDAEVAVLGGEAGVQQAGAVNVGHEVVVRSAHKDRGEAIEVPACCGWYFVFMGVCGACAVGRGASIRCVFTWAFPRTHAHGPMWWNAVQAQFEQQRCVRRTKRGSRTSRAWPAGPRRTCRRSR